MRTLAGAIILAALALPARAQDAADEKQPPQEVTEFNKLFEEWKTVVGRLREIQIQYKQAKPEDREALKKEFYDELLPRAEKMEPQLREGAVSAYQADPSQKRIAEFVAAMAKEAQDERKHADALRLAKVLIANDFPNPEIFELAGRAAYESQPFVEDADAVFADAEKYLQLASEAGAISDRGRAMLQEVQKELQLRKAENKPDDDPMALPRVLLKTSKGDIVLELFEDQAPNTVANFIYLIEKKFYDGLTFHRVLDGFMAQGGCPKGDGSGGPGYQIPCECYEPDYRLHFPGSLSMAHSGKDTGGSQFFLTFARTQHLDGRHTVFGRVISGMDVLGKLQRRDPDDADAPEPDKIVSMTVLRKRDHEYKPETVSGKDPDGLLKMPGSSGDEPAPEGGAKSGGTDGAKSGGTDGAKSGSTGGAKSGGTDGAP